ncbi:hypothetical protein GGI19_000414 [Coemansia pectinata]|uniref:AA9 family lytic polysaccharide monooxygenase n=1 Tax=Coemansia pectinata TaxID=1052879 RepID=A0A9W8H413_9FUNG|nr:hypothetical protein GGI19_000414 [Coemansia pectinata]
MLAWTANAHTHLRDLKIGTKQYERGVCIRPYNSTTLFSFPAKDPTNKYVRCRTPSVDSKAEKICDVNAGSKITVSWHESELTSSQGINPSHMGPCIVWMAPLESNGEGEVWAKIFEDGYNPKTKTWCIDTVNKNNGTLDITIPSDVLAGKYILRTEIIALHLAAVKFTGGKDGAEYYSNCAEINVIGGGKTVPKGVAIPGVYTIDMPGIIFNTSAPFTSYKIPGPPVYKVGDPSGPVKPNAGVKKPCIKKRRRRQLAQDQ